MRKLLLSLFILCGLSVVSNAQTAGKFWLGGGVSFYTSKLDTLDRTVRYSISPEVGYNISDSWGIGISIGYTHWEYASSNDEKTYKDKSDAFHVNPFVRYSFLKSNIGNLFIDGGVGYSYSKTKYGDRSDTYYAPQDAETNSFNIGLRPGFMINLSEKVVLISKVGFIGYTYQKYGDNKTDTFSFDFSLNNIIFGANIRF